MFNSFSVYYPQYFSPPQITLYRLPFANYSLQIPLLQIPHLQIRLPFADYFLQIPFCRFFFADSFLYLPLHKLPLHLPLGNLPSYLLMHNLLLYLPSYRFVLVQFIIIFAFAYICLYIICHCTCFHTNLSLHVCHYICLVQISIQTYCLAILQFTCNQTSLQNFAHDQISL